MPKIFSNVLSFGARRALFHSGDPSSIMLRFAFTASWKAYDNNNAHTLCSMHSSGNTRVAACERKMFVNMNRDDDEVDSAPLLLPNTATESNEECEWRQRFFSYWKDCCHAHGWRVYKADTLRCMPVGTVPNMLWKVHTWKAQMRQHTMAQMQRLLHSHTHTHTLAKHFLTFDYICSNAISTETFFAFWWNRRIWPTFWLNSFNSRLLFYFSFIWSVVFVLTVEYTIVVSLQGQFGLTHTDEYEYTVQVMCVCRNIILVCVVVIWACWTTIVARFDCSTNIENYHILDFVLVATNAD